MKKQKPFAPAAEENKADILRVLKQVITEENFRLMEVGSGTGQHAVFCAPHFPSLQWVTTDTADKLEGITMWLREAQVPNVHGPVAYEVGKDEFPRQKCDVVFAANIFHILSWKNDKTLIKALGNRLREGSKVLFYGAFNYGGKFTSKSNEAFDAALKAKNPQSGIRHFEDVQKAMTKAGFEFVKDFEMLFNNRILYFKRLEHVKDVPCPETPQAQPPKNSPKLS